MKTHELKVWPDFYPAIADGTKTFEVRQNDRGFQVGDTLHLREYSPGPDEYTGRHITKRVVYLVNGDDVKGFAFGVKPGFVVMGIA